MQAITTTSQIYHIENMQDLIWSCQMTINVCQIFSLQTGYHSFVTCFCTSVYHESNNCNVVSSIVAFFFRPSQLAYPCRWGDMIPRFSRTVSDFSLLFHFLMTEVPIKQKQVHRFALKINGLVSILQGALYERVKMLFFAHSCSKLLCNGCKSKLILQRCP